MVTVAAASVTNTSTDAAAATVENIQLTNFAALRQIGEKCISPTVLGDCVIHQTSHRFFDTREKHGRLIELHQVGAGRTQELVQQRNNRTEDVNHVEAATGAAATVWLFIAFANGGNEANGALSNPNGRMTEKRYYVVG